MDRYFAFAAFIFCLALSDASKAATVRAWLSEPDARTFPGTMIVSFCLVYLSIRLRFTEIRCLLGLARYSATSCQIPASFPCFVF